jgi:hypothetical protein
MGSCNKRRYKNTFFLFCIFSVFDKVRLVIQSGLLKHYPPRSPFYVYIVRSRSMPTRRQIPYRFEATTPEGAIQALVNYLNWGYCFYVTGWIREPKEPDLVDRKLIAKYAITGSPKVRARRKQQGLANVQYLRYDRWFILLATKGRHPFFDSEASRLQDARRVGIPFGGHILRVVQGGGLPRSGPGEGKRQVRVAIQRSRYLELKAFFLDNALRWSVERFRGEFFQAPFEPYAPVRQQLGTILRDVNRRRKAASLDPVPATAVPWRRKLVSPFQPLSKPSIVR